MTPNRKGNDTVANRAGLTSLYRGTPYVSTMIWKAFMNSSGQKYVGRLLLELCTLFT